MRVFNSAEAQEGGWEEINRVRISRIEEKAGPRVKHF